jgi:gas vesicle protein
MSVVSKTLKFTGGALIGLGVGALTALILAPQSGQVTTAQLRARLDDALDAGRRAQQDTETELHARWEATIREGTKDDTGEVTVLNTPEIKAEKAAEREREKAEQARKDALRDLDRASKDLDKARKKL